MSCHRQVMYIFSSLDISLTFDLSVFTWMEQCWLVLVSSQVTVVMLNKIYIIFYLSPLTSSIAVRKSYIYFPEESAQIEPNFPIIACYCTWEKVSVFCWMKIWTTFTENWTYNLGTLKRLNIWHKIRTKNSCTGHVGINYSL